MKKYVILIFSIMVLILLVLICLQWTSSQKTSLALQRVPKNGVGFDITNKGRPKMAELEQPVRESQIDDFDRSTARRLRGNRRENLPIVREAMAYGVRAKITLHVRDAKGDDVENAQVLGQFNSRGREEREFTKFTDDKGMLVLESQCVGDFYYIITKDGHYPTHGQYWFFLEGEDCVHDGRWIPWNPTWEVVLKEKRNPIPMYTKYSKVFLPLKGKAFAFDCLVGDLVEPYGKGKETDLFFTYSSDLSGEAERKYTNQLVIAASSVSGGIQKLTMDSWSEFRSVHNAPDGGYQPVIVFSCKSESAAIRQEVKFSNDICLVFQSRVQTSKDGRVLSANYGKIYPMNFDYGEAPPDKGQGRVEFGYYFNPTPNDRNLEFDGKNNLFKPDWKDSWPRNP